MVPGDKFPPHTLERLVNSYPIVTSALAGLPVFIAHGTKDETVPVSMAREAHAALARARRRKRFTSSAEERSRPESF